MEWKDGKVIQCRGLRNCGMTVEVQAFCDTFAKKMNERDALRAIAYNGDTKFVRIEKRLHEQSQKEEQENREPRNYAWTKEKQKLNTVLLIIKENVDDAYFCNQAIVENAEYFKKNILTYVTRCFKDADIATDREARKYVSEVINREYQTVR